METTESLQPWHPGYLGWYDIVLGACLAVDILKTRSRIPFQLFAFQAMLLIAVVVSVAGSAWGLNWWSLGDDVAYCLRFSLSFLAAVALVLRAGEKGAEAAVIGMCMILMITSVFVFQLQYGTFNRISASGMTVGSFSQAMLILSVIAMVRTNVPLILGSMMFLIMTFSRTALALWAICLAGCILGKSRFGLAKQLLIGVLIVLLSGAALFQLEKNPEFELVINDRLDREAISTFNMRFLVWEYGADLIRSGSVPLTGIGLHFTPTVLMDYVLPSPTDATLIYFPSFHTILLEYGIGLGILALPIFGMIFWRIWVTWRWKCYLPFMIFILFFVTQCVDFTFYRPKEVVMWGAFLGFAEGQWLMHRRRQVILRSRPMLSNRRSRLGLEQPATTDAVSGVRR